MLGDSLNPYSFIITLEASTPQGIDEQIMQIKRPIKILGMYSDGKKHYCKLASDRKIKIIKEQENGSIRRS